MTFTNKEREKFIEFANKNKPEKLFSKYGVSNVEARSENGVEIQFKDGSEIFTGIPGRTYVKYNIPFQIAGKRCSFGNLEILFEGGNEMISEDIRSAESFSMNETFLPYNALIKGFYDRIIFLGELYLENKKENPSMNVLYATEGIFNFCKGRVLQSKDLEKMLLKNHRDTMLTNSNLSQALNQ